jgi:Glycosyl transferase family 11
MSGTNACVVVKVRAGLGNQFFQYAAARALADRLACRVVLDTSIYWPDSLRKFSLLDYNIRASMLYPFERLRLNKRSRLVSRAGVKLNALFRSTVLENAMTVEDPGRQHVVDLPTSTDRPIYLKGYWQDYRYFRDDADAIVEDLQPRRLAASVRKQVREIEACESVAIHVRRGDYIGQEYFGLCGMDYYEAAVAHVAARVRSPVLFIFTEDPAWVREHCSFGFPTHVIAGSTWNPVDDFFLMSRCRHKILANSTFSWWAPILGSYPDSVVVSPKTWFHGEKDWTPALAHWHLI